MGTPAGSILPQSFFTALSQLWGSCAYLAGAIAASGFVLRGATNGWDPLNLLRLVTRLVLVALGIVFLRQWLMQLNDVVSAFGTMMNIDPTTVDSRFAQFIAGQTGGATGATGTSFWSVLWHTGSIGTAVAYALLWLFGWLAYAVQFVVKLVGDVLLSVGWALSPIFLAFFMLRPMENAARKYVTGLVALVCWPFGWIIAAVVTNAMLDAAASANLIPSATAPGASTVLPALTVLLIGGWMLISSFLAPYVTTKVLLAGANPAGAFMEGLSGVGQATAAGGLGAATAAATGGAAAGGVIAAAAAGAIASGTESAARGGAQARASTSMTNGLAGLYNARMSYRRAGAMEAAAAAEMQEAAAGMSFTEELKRRGGVESPPPSNDPNREAKEIDDDNNT